MLLTKQIICSVARRKAGCALRPVGVMALQQQRFFSGEVVDEAAVAKAAELKAIRNTERLAQERYKRDKTVTPWFARTVAPVAAQEAAPAGQVSQLAGVPNDIKKRKVTIYRPARAASSTGRFKTKAWKLEFDTKPRWVNHLMGYYSSGDPVGVFQMQFETSEDAAKFCEKMGYEYEVREFHESKNFQGQKSYDYNFLQEDVQTNMKSGGRRQGQKWFKNDTALRSGWANIPRSDYGKAEPYRKDANKELAKNAPKFKNSKLSHISKIPLTDFNNSNTRRS